MLRSRFFLPTLREAPQEAEIASHKWMLRAGMIRQLASGLYTWLPLGLRVLRKVEKVVREEMDRAGAQEVLMPSVQPKELWEASGRWQKYGPELLRFADRHGREFCYGPTHEEVVTDLVRREVQSHRHLPLVFYQIQTKFRDEIRPRFGVMRAREFIMKDAYSFHADEESLAATYAAMHQAYRCIFERLGLEFRVVEADTGAIGGARSHEFHVLAETGEDVIAYSPASSYAANLELASSLEPPPRPSAREPMTRRSTPGARTVHEAACALGIETHRVLKTLIAEGAFGWVAFLLAGDDSLNAVKAQKLPEMGGGCKMVPAEEIFKRLGVSPGSIGPIGLDIPVIADRRAAAMADFACGANEDGWHFSGVNFGRDLLEPKVADIRLVREGDIAPDGSGPLAFCRGIEVGHIFQLGTKYSEALDAVFLDARQEKHPMLMGCYGIGVSRIVAAAIEQRAAFDAFSLPRPMAPFDVGLIAIGLKKDPAVADCAFRLHGELKSRGIEVLFDDRDLRAGVMFADMELAGIGMRVVAGEKGVARGVVEIQEGKDKKVEVPIFRAAEEILERLR